MKDILANLYNKVVSFFHQTDEKTSNAKDVACNRLKLVLMQDRTNLTPAIMDRMRRELIDLLSKYMELDRELLDLNFEHEDEQMALMLSIPVIRAKNEDEIRAILEEEDEQRKKLEALANKENDDESDDESDEESDEEDNECSDNDSDDEQSEDSSDEEETDSDETENESDSTEPTEEDTFTEVDSEEEDEEDEDDDDVDEEIDNDPSKTKKQKKKEKFFKKKKETQEEAE